jgi:hypothetical protein
MTCEDINVSIVDAESINVTVADSEPINVTTYASQAGKLVQVNSTETGLEFTDSPTVVDWDEIGGTQSDINISGFTNDSGYLTSETDPVFTASQANNITETDITNLSNLSGTNTGDDIKSSVTFTNLEAFETTVSRRGRTSKAKSMTTYDITADASGSASVTIKKAIYSNYPSTLTTIGTVTLTTAQKTTGSLAVSLSAGDYIIFELTSCSGINELLVELY